MHLPTTLDAYHTAADLALQAMILLLENCIELIPTNRDLGVAFATPAIRTYAPSTLSNFDEVVVLELGMSAVGYAELAEVRMLVHLL